ncbi:MAG: DUF2070 family protein [Candidatus Marsarchaeota archaeon]|nr:DUF2070 family protein [Candidatus Marsarchaeota archaeon]
MPDKNRDVTGFVKYFSISAPGSLMQAILLLILGMVTGIISSLAIHETTGNISSFIALGVSTGAIMITLPAILTVMLNKIADRRIQLKHAFFSVLVITSVYAVFMVINFIMFSFLQRHAVAYFVLLLGNAGILGYWMIVNRVVMFSKRKPFLTALAQPLLNVFFFFPVSKYMLDLNVPVGTVLIKLLAGMSIFMIVGYMILFVIDRPSKKAFKLSGIDIISSMVSQWLYNAGKEVDIFMNSSEAKGVETKIMVLKGRSGYKAVFIKPDIHYGPFAGVGGSVATELIGKEIVKRYSTTPFILHGAVDIDDNPVNRDQIYKMSRAVISTIDNMSDFKQAKGYIGNGEEKPCKAINIRIGDINILTLTKAPTVTEDINREVGASLEKIVGGETILIDAHNSRFESASKSELMGIYKGSKYIRMYENAIRMSISKKQNKRMRFGAAFTRISQGAWSKDLGNGYTSVGVFEFKGKRFCMVYFDANNMLPTFRSNLIDYIRKNCGMYAEIYTTDTHSVNSLALSASNVVGRYTNVNEIKPIIKGMIDKAISEMEYVDYSYQKIIVKGFRTWGTGAGDALVEMTRDTIRSVKKTVPIIVVLGFIVAAWVMYAV